MKRTILFFAGIFSVYAALFAKEPGDSSKMIEDELKRIDSIEKSFNYKTGKNELGSGIASINVPSNFKFLGATEAKYVIEDLWGNPKGQTPLGVLFPANSGATDAGGYAFIVKFEDIGYVKDNDADKINYDDLLKDLKEGSAEDNKEREKMNLFTMDLIGWAAKPYYDKEKKVLHWAKEFSIPGVEEHTLNYDVRILGRKGVLTLQAVSSMDQLDSVNNHVEEVLGMVTFNEGNRYTDFDSKTDNIAAWTIGGLVAGKVLAKVGFFAIILKFLKFIILGIAVAGGAIWRFITGKKKKEEEFVYQPQPGHYENSNASPQE
jgi:uncharacterized membrane-anchored protein